jgi:hypothetical protein
MGFRGIIWANEYGGPRLFEIRRTERAENHKDRQYCQACRSGCPVFICSDYPSKPHFYGSPLQSYADISPSPFKRFRPIKSCVPYALKYNIFGLIPKTSYVTQTLNIKYRGTIEPGLCVDWHLPMCRGTIFLHIYRGPPYSFAQNIPLSPIFMGHRFNPMLTTKYTNKIFCRTPRPACLAVLPVLVIFCPLGPTNFKKSGSSVFIDKIFCLCILFCIANATGIPERSQSTRN